MEHKINYIHTKEIHNRKSAEEILPVVFSFFKPKSITDIGCGTGSWLAVAEKLGVPTVIGVDGISADKKLMEIEENKFKLHDLIQPLDLKTKFDLAISLEVAEHLPETAADNLIDILTSHSDVVLFSAALPGQGGQFHVNEQWPEYWQKKFEKKGYLVYDVLRDILWENENIEWWYRQNILLYAKIEYSKYWGNPTKEVSSKIHPSLYNQKIRDISHLDKIIENRIWRPKLIPTLRLLAKSIIR